MRQNTVTINTSKEETNQLVSILSQYLPKVSGVCPHLRRRYTPSLSHNCFGINTPCDSNCFRFGIYTKAVANITTQVVPPWAAHYTGSWLMNLVSVFDTDPDGLFREFGFIPSAPLESVRSVLQPSNTRSRERTRPEWFFPESTNHAVGIIFDRFTST